MMQRDYKITLTVNATPQESFKSINRVSKWWTDDFVGSSQNLNDEFSVRFGDVHFSKQKLIEVVQDQRIVWLVTDSKLNFIKDKDEWTNTKIRFEVSNQEGQTQIHFTHFGLIPDVECYESCVQGWDYFIKGSLFKLITQGKGTPGLE